MRGRSSPAAVEPARSGGGLFVVFEGPEGAGKSTQCALLAERLRAGGRLVTLTREPGGTRLGDAIRRLLLDPSGAVEPLAELLLYSASRAQIVSEVIVPALARGEDVVSDRFVGATVAYQGHGRGLDAAFVATVNDRVTGGLRPHLTVLLDIDPAIGLDRASARSGSDRLESAGLAFHERVRDGYLRQAEADPTWLVVDARLSQDAIAAATWDAVVGLLAARTGAAHG